MATSLTTGLLRNEDLLESGHRFDFQGESDHLLDGGYHFSVGICDESVGLSFPLCPPGTSNPVSVGLRNIGNIKIDDVRDTLNIDTPGSNIGSHHDVVIALSETTHCPIALILGHVSLQGDSSMSVLFQFLSQLPSPSLGSGEDDCGIKIILAKKVSQHLDLAFFTHGIECMFDGLCWHRVVDFRDEWVGQDLFC